MQIHVLSHHHLSIISELYICNACLIMIIINACCTQIRVFGLGALPGMESSSKFSHGTVNWVSGLAGGTAQVLVGHPFDTIKVNLHNSTINLITEKGKNANLE